VDNTTDTQTCESLSGPKAQGVTNFTVLRDENDKEYAVNLKYQGSNDTCQSGENLGLDIKIFCDKEMGQGLTRDVKFVKEDKCIQYIEMHSKHGCPTFDAIYIFRFLDQWKALWGMGFIAIGVFVTFLGRKSIKPTIFLLAFIGVTFFLLLAIYSLFMEHLRNNYIILGVMVFAAIIGILVGIFLVKNIKHGVALLGGLAGFTIAVLVVNALQITD